MYVPYLKLIHTFLFELEVLIEREIIINLGTKRRGRLTCTRQGSFMEQWAWQSLMVNTIMYGTLMCSGGVFQGRHVSGTCMNECARKGSGKFLKSC